MHMSPSLFLKGIWQNDQIFNRNNQTEFRPTGGEPHAQTAVAIPVAVDNVAIYDSDVQTSPVMQRCHEGHITKLFVL